jgi:hypothetical protein
MKLRSAVLFIFLVFDSACGIIAYSPAEPVTRPSETQVQDKIEFLSFSYTPCLARSSDGERKASPCESQLV